MNWLIYFASKFKIVAAFRFKLKLKNQTLTFGACISGVHRSKNLVYEYVKTRNIFQNLIELKNKKPDSISFESGFLFLFSKKSAIQQFTFLNRFLFSEPLTS